MNTKRFIVVLLVACLLLSVTLTTVAGVLLYRGNKFCLKFLEDWLLAINQLIVFGSVLHPNLIKLQLGRASVLSVVR
ncbi:hypothetical protein CCACVL1_05482 [Corchorus capsularis]|uniref:Uncharacterized protein n=1 Tax=Corchorus capsularis TaxID=210143 RepID=A0A1R3JK98_COCAP|nr:hypothetical protein CCACVL1_05482 [Corchorus capsularis]